MQRFHPGVPAVGPTKEQLAEKQAWRAISAQRVTMDEAAQDLFWNENISSTDEIIKELKKMGLIPPIFLDGEGNITPDGYNRINEMKIGKKNDRSYISALEDIVTSESVSGKPIEQIIKFVKGQIGFHKRLLDENGELSKNGRRFIESRMYKEKDITGHGHDDDGDER